MTSCRLHEDDLRRMFNVFDLDRSGMIDHHELCNAFRALGWWQVTASHCKSIMEDHFGEGCEALSFAQFTSVCGAVELPTDSPQECAQAFGLFDRSRLGKISPGDLKVAGKIATGRDVPDALIRSIMAAADKNKDGYLSFDEFRVAVAKGGRGTEAGALDASKLSFNVAPEEEARMEIPSSAAMAHVDSSSTFGGRRNPQSTTGGGDASQPQSLAGTMTQSRNAVGTFRTFGGVPVIVSKNRISKQEVRSALVQFGYGMEDLAEEDFEAIFNDADADKDEALTVKEYQTLLDGFGESSRETTE